MPIGKGVTIVRIAQLHDNIVFKLISNLLLFIKDVMLFICINRVKKKIFYLVSPNQFALVSAQRRFNI